MSNYIERSYHASTLDYHENFWNVMKGKDAFEQRINKGRHNQTGTYAMPDTSENKFNQAITKRSVFRNIASVITAYNGGYHINAKNCDDMAMWVPEGASIPVYDGADYFTNIPIESYKLGVVTKLDLGFVTDASFSVEKYLIDRLAKMFDRAEENAFINGDGNEQPTGILHEVGGADTVVTTATLTYDDVIVLYFSVKAEYRKSSVWLMNDETATALRKLKDSDGNYLWRDSDDTILGKRIVISEFMPNAENSNKPIAFGDFSYYWIVDRTPVSVRTLREKFLVIGQIGYLSFEFLDAKLIRKEAIKVLQITDTDTNTSNK